MLLLELGSSESGASALVQEIHANASSFIKKPVTLNRLVGEIDKLDWYSARQEGLGDLYEGLLQKNAEEKKSGAGQYFTPRPLIDAMVAVMQPQRGDSLDLAWLRDDSTEDAADLPEPARPTWPATPWSNRKAPWPICDQSWPNWDTTWRRRDGGVGAGVGGVLIAMGLPIQRNASISLFEDPEPGAEPPLL